MYLQPYNYPHIRMMPDHPDCRGASPTLQLQSHQLSHSQGNLLHLPPVRSPSPHQLQVDSRQRSRSLNILSEQPPAQPAARATYAHAANISTPPATSKHTPPPMITVEMDRGEGQRGRSQSIDSEGSDLASNSSDFSFGDELSSSSASSTFNLSIGANNGQLHLSRTPPPMPSNHLSPESGFKGKMIPSVSDPTLYKGPMTPKVPPRPRAQEILTRCSTVTRKNATTGTPSPTQPEIPSR